MIYKGSSLMIFFWFFLNNIFNIFFKHEKLNSNFTSLVHAFITFIRSGYILYYNNKNQLLYNQLYEWSSSYFIYDSILCIKNLGKKPNLMSVAYLVHHLITMNSLNYKLYYIYL